MTRKNLFKQTGSGSWHAEDEDGTAFAQIRVRQLFQLVAREEAADFLDPSPVRLSVEY
jgi:hypothetical protein